MNDIERAIEVLKYYKPKGNESIYERGATHKDRESFNLAISALEKQTAKKVEVVEKEYQCATCGMRYWRKNGVKHCIDCGQKLDWRVGE